MKSLFRILSLAGLAATLTLSNVFAQDSQGGDANGGGGRRNRQGGAGGPGGGAGGPGGPGGPGGGNFDPAQFRQRMMDRIREQLGVKDDEEWKLISERIEKVNTARREVGAGRMGGFGGFGGRGPGGPGGDNNGGGRRGGFGGETSPEAEALQKAIENNAPTEEIKAKLEKYRAVIKGKEEKLAQAQEKLREVLSAKQEAAAVLAGLLK